MAVLCRQSNRLLCVQMAWDPNSVFALRPCGSNMLLGNLYTFGTSLSKPVLLAVRMVPSPVTTCHEVKSLEAGIKTDTEANEEGMQF